MIRPLKTTILTMLLMLVPLLLLADDFSDRQMHNLSKENGLSGETVSQIITGPDGQVWIATNDGVCRYNGREVTGFAMPHKSNDPNYTFALAFTPDHTLYAATNEGIFRLRRGSKAFTRTYSSIDKAETILAVGDRLFVGNRQGFHILHNDKVRTITVGATPMGIENGIRDIRLGQDKGVWFVSRYGLHRYDLKTGKVRSYDIAHLLPERAALSHLLPIAGHFFIGTKNNGLFIYDIRTRQVKRVMGIGNSISYLAPSPGGNVSLAAGGAFLLDGHTGKIIRQFNQRSDDKNYRLPTDAVYCYYRDSNGVDWFGFYRYGMSYTYHSEKLFQTYRMGSFTTEGMDVRSVLVNGSQKVIGTGDDVWFIDETRHLVRHYTSEQLGNAHAISTIAYFNGSYYVGSFDAGLHRFSAASFDMQSNPKNPLLSTTTIGALASDGQNSLWIGTSEGLFILDSHDRLRHFTENNSRIIGGQINAICFMPGGTTWIGGPLGLCLYNPQTQTFERDHFPDGFFNTVRIRDITTGHNNQYFFNATNTIFYSDRLMQHFGEFQSRRNLVINGCLSFLDDGKGHYWIATSDGLFCSDYGQTNILHFGYGDGLRCQLIAGRLYKGAGDLIWVPTSNGLMYIHQSSLSGWQKRTRYKMLLYHIQVNGNPVDLELEDEANTNHHLSMKWNIVSSVLTLRPLLADFARPFGRMYEYRIDGKSEWQIVRDGNDLRIHHLSIGRHRLELRLAGVPGTTTVYTISVSPSVGAYLELLLLVVVLAIVVLWHRYRKTTSRLLAERNEIEDALVEAETEKQEKQIENEAKDEATKYQRVHIDDDECRRIVDKLRKYIEAERVYLNPDLKMSDLADHLHLSPSKLSQVFSLYLKENWYDFINAYRLAEFKRLVSEGACKQYTLLALSAKCGFKKSSFFTTFRKVEGMTPTEYLKKNNINI